MDCSALSGAICWTNTTDHWMLSNQLVFVKRRCEKLSAGGNAASGDASNACCLHGAPAGCGVQTTSSCKCHLVWHSSYDFLNERENVYIFCIQESYRNSCFCPLSLSHYVELRKIIGSYPIKCSFLCNPEKNNRCVGISESVTVALFRICVEQAQT